MDSVMTWVFSRSRRTMNSKRTVCMPFERISIKRCGASGVPRLNATTVSWSLKRFSRPPLQEAGFQFARSGSWYKLIGCLTPDMGVKP